MPVTCDITDLIASLLASDQHLRQQVEDAEQEARKAEEAYAHSGVDLHDDDRIG